MATTTNAFPTPASEYPAITNGLRPYLSLDLPEISFVKPAAASAHPSIKPSARGAAPITPVSRIGNSGYKSSLAASCVNETKVRSTKFLLSHFFI